MSKKIDRCEVADLLGIYKNWAQAIAILSNYCADFPQHVAIVKAKRVYEQTEIIQFAETHNVADELRKAYQLRGELGAVIPPETKENSALIRAIKPTHSNLLSCYPGVSAAVRKTVKVKSDWQMTRRK